MNELIIALIIAASVLTGGCSNGEAEMSLSERIEQSEQERKGEPASEAALAECKKVEGILAAVILL